MKVFYESLDNIPEEERQEFVETEWDGKKGYQHKTVASLAHAYNETKGKRDKDRQRLEELEGKVGGFEEEKRKAAEEAEQRAYEKAKKEGNIDEIEARHEQQIQHAQKTGYDEGYAAAQKEFGEQAAKQRAQSVAGKIANKYGIDEFAAELLQEQIVKSVQASPESDKDVFLDADGNATTWTAEQFEKEVVKNPRFKRLIKADVATNGGGGANGSNNANGVRKPLKDMSQAERLQFKQSDPTGFQQALQGN
ncbi:MAG: hypothetical protein ACPHUL_00010 [Marinomonas gallaica]